MRNIQGRQRPVKISNAFFYHMMDTILTRGIYTNVWCLNGVHCT